MPVRRDLDRGPAAGAAGQARPLTHPTQPQPQHVSLPRGQTGNGQSGPRGQTGKGPYDAASAGLFTSSCG